MSNTSDNNTQAGALHTGEDSFYMDPVLYTGRPVDCTGRLEKEIRTYDLLDELQIPYWRLDHDATATIDACHDVDVRLDIEICTTRRRQSKAAMRWNGFWTSASARTCFSAMPRKPIFTCS